MTDQPQRSIDERIAALVAADEAHDARMRRTDERLGAIAESLELLTLEVRELSANSKRDADSIRALARIAEIHERRLTALEGDQPAQ
jgi:hypothetical protein